MFLLCEILSREYLSYWRDAKSSSFRYMDLGSYARKLVLNTYLGSLDHPLRSSIQELVLGVKNGRQVNDTLTLDAAKTFNGGHVWKLLILIKGDMKRSTGPKCGLTQQTQALKLTKVFLSQFDDILLLTHPSRKGHHINKKSILLFHLNGSLLLGSKVKTTTQHLR